MNIKYEFSIVHPENVQAIAENITLPYIGMKVTSELVSEIEQKIAEEIRRRVMVTVKAVII